MSRPILDLGWKVLSLLLLGAATAHACSCLPPPPPAQALRMSDAVFVGTVVDIERAPKNGEIATVRATLQVARYWKGLGTGTVTVKTASSTPACGFPFQKGQTYLVYASGHDTLFETNLCTRTKLVNGMTAEEEELGLAKTIP
jgi:hypothetical protein